MDREKTSDPLDLAWQTIEDNQFGTDNLWFGETAAIEPMLGVNLVRFSKGSYNMIEYCNFPANYYSDLRKNGNLNPYGVKYWCLGNEMDGPWQICHLM